MSAPELISPEFIVSNHAKQLTIIGKDYTTLLAMMNTLVYTINLLIKLACIPAGFTIRFGTPYQNECGNWLCDLDQIEPSPNPYEEVL